MGGTESSVFPPTGERKWKITVSPLDLCKQTELTVKATIVDEKKGQPFVQLMLKAKRGLGFKLYSSGSDPLSGQRLGDTLTVSHVSKPYHFALDNSYEDQLLYEGRERGYWFWHGLSDFPAFTGEWLDENKMLTFTLHWRSGQFIANEARLQLMAAVQEAMTKTSPSPPPSVTAIPML